MVTRSSLPTTQLEGEAAAEPTPGRDGSEARTGVDQPASLVVERGAKVQAYVDEEVDVDQQLDHPDEAADGDVEVKAGLLCNK
eukprot:SAG22_NODE_301_length_12744_cov_19.648189_14_plen_83_part_00